MAFASPSNNLSELGLSDGMRIADFGAGAGHYAVLAADAVGDSGEVYVIDIQEELLTKARTLDGRHRKSLHFIRGDLETANGSKLADGICDVVIISNLLFSVENKEAVAREAYRVLMPKGKAMVIDWTDSFGGIGPASEHIVSASAVRQLFESAGFAPVKDFDAGDHHFGMIFRK